MRLAGRDSVLGECVGEIRERPIAVFARIGLREAPEHDLSAYPLLSLHCAVNVNQVVRTGFNGVVLVRCEVDSVRPCSDSNAIARVMTGVTSSRSSSNAT